MTQKTLEKKPVRTLLVEDSPGDARLMQIALRGSTEPDFKLTHVACIEHASDCLLKEQFDLLLLDLSLPDSDGLDTIKAACSLAPHTAIVFLSIIHLLNGFCRDNHEKEIAAPLSFSPICDRYSD